MLHETPKVGQKIRILEDNWNYSNFKAGDIAEVLEITNSHITKRPRIILTGRNYFTKGNTYDGQCAWSQLELVQEHTRKRKSLAK